MLGTGHSIKRPFDTPAGGRRGRANGFLHIRANGSPHSAPRAQAGFTLLEVLVAVAIFAFLASGAYAVMEQALKAREQMEVKLARLAEVQRVLAMLQRDVEQLALRPSRDEFGDPNPLFRADGHDDQKSYFRFTRGGWRNPLGLPRSGLQYVGWRLDKGRLRREYALYTDRAAQTPLRGGVMLKGVESLSLRMLEQADKQAGGKGQWRDAWPKDETNKRDATVPRALEITLEMKDMGRIVRVLRLPEVAARDIDEGGKTP
ncbi:MAG: type II secretion system minor pseudopilin GspJ [Gammaproteobacteria bacterium]|nr:type II secretion system minor pseudopilin GspJ [Gammaproteobacteria bacterium]